MKKCLFALCILILSSVSHHAHAAKYYFGKGHTIHRITDVKIVGTRGEKLFLGYKTSSFYLLAGVYITNDGYVLGVEGDTKSYYPLSMSDIAAYQKQSLLPKPLPSYKIPFWDYIAGFSLWLLIGFVVIYVLADSIYTSIKAKTDWERFRKSYPKVMSGAILTHGSASEVKVGLANRWHVHMFDKPLDEAELYKHIDRLEGAGQNYVDFVGNSAKRLAVDHKLLLLKIYSEILMSVRYQDEERKMLFEIGRRMKLKPKDIQEFIILLDAEYDARFAIAYQPA